MKIIAWILTILLFVASVAVFVDALTTSHGVWLSLPLLVLSGVLLGPAILMLPALLGLYDLAIELNRHRFEVRKSPEA